MLARYLPRGAPISPSLDHPVNRGVKGWWLVQPQTAAGNAWYDQLGRYAGTLTGFSPTSGWRGSTQRFGSMLLDGASYVAVPATAAVIAPAFTAACWVRTTSATTQAAYAEGDSANTSSFFNLAVNSTGTANIGLRDASANTVSLSGATNVADGNWHHIAGVADGTNLNLYVDGRADVASASMAALVGGYGVAGTRLCTIGQRRRNDTGIFVVGSLDDVRTYNRAMSAAEVRQLHLEGLAGYPEAMLWGRMPAAANVFVMPAAQGAFAESGTDAGLYLGYRTIATAGAYAETGVAAGTYLGRRTIATAGTFSESGQAAGLLYARRAVVAAGAYSLAGVSANLPWSHRVAIAAGSFSESGVAAGLLKGRTLTASAGAYALTGVAAGLLRTRRTIVSAGSLALAGQSAGLYLGHRAAAAAGTFSEAGAGAGLYKGRTLVASAGAFTESGVAAGLLRSRRLAISAGPHLLTGVNAGLTYSASTGTAAGRERDIRHDVRDLLDATGTFDGVYLGGLPEDAGQVADDARCCSIDPVKEDHTIDDSLSGCVVVHGSLKLTFLARAYDDQLADEACERMFLVAANALNGRSLAGLTFPVFTQITKGHWLPRKPPERRKEAVLEYRYLVETWNTFGIAD